MHNNIYFLVNNDFVSSDLKIKAEAILVKSGIRNSHADEYNFFILYPSITNTEDEYYDSGLVKLKITDICNKLIKKELSANYVKKNTNDTEILKIINNINNTVQQ